jgi:hypothetical protein
LSSSRDSQEERLVRGETDALPEVWAAFKWWELPYDFDHKVNTRPDRRFTVRVAGTLAGGHGCWMIDRPALIRLQ